MKTYISWVFTILLFTACGQEESQQQEPSPKNSFKSEVIKLDSAFNTHVMPGTAVELLAGGYDWTEGPLWLPEQQRIIWSDVPRNVIYQWSEKEGVSEYLAPSGLTNASDGNSVGGSNGLLLSAKGQLVICQHGDRRMAVMDASLDAPKASFITLTDNWEGKRFNSPNDAAIGPGNAIYFTDPPYGLKDRENNPSREIPFFGVYRVDTAGNTSLMDSSLTRPNGIAFNSDMSRCYVANSDPKKAIWKVYDVDEDGDLVNGRLFFDATSMVPNEKGLPDGLKVNNQGIIFGTGPGGVLVFNPEGKHLGTIATGEAISNCALNHDESVLYLTSHMYLARVKIK